MDYDYSALQTLIAQIQSLMVAYVTGQRHADQPRRYEQLYRRLASTFEALGIPNPNPHTTLQEFDGFCRLRNLSHYSQRRDYVANLYQKILNGFFEEHDHIERPEAAIAPGTTRDQQAIANPAKVFVVHGRNSRLNQDFFSFLRALHLEPIEWSEAIALTGEASPYIGDVLSAAFSSAQAIVVLMTPDDLAVLKKPLQREHDEPYEKKLSGQARPNVLFEAGLAFGRNPKRTVILQVGKLRPFSDLQGRHVVRLDNTAERRQEVANRLRTAGCAVSVDGSDWLSVGDFVTRPEEGDSKESDEEAQNDLSVAPDVTVAREKPDSSLKKHNSFEGVPFSTNPSTFLQPGETFPDNRNTGKSLVVPDVQHLFLRIIPSVPRVDIKSSKTVLDLIASGRLKPMGERLRDWTHDRNKYGAYVYYEENGKILNFTQVFKSGELWGIDSCIEKEKLMQRANVDVGFFPAAFLEGIFTSTLANYLQFARDTLRLSLPFKFIAGATDVAGYRMGANLSGYNALYGEVLENDIVFEGIIDGYSETAAVILLPFFRHIWEECGLDRPDKGAAPG